LQDLSAVNDVQLKDDNFKLLDILHHFTSGIKSIATAMTYEGMDELRQSCGGAGFLQSSLIAEIW